MRISASLAALLLAIAPLSAQMTLSSTGDGGAVPGNSTLEMRGSPNTPFLLLFSETEVANEPIPGVQLDIDLSYLQICLSTPALFLGTLDGAGRAQRTIPVPNLPGLYGKTMSMQSLYLQPLGGVSNLVRVTLQEPNTFQATRESAIAPIVTGQGFVQDDGKVLLLGGSGPVVQEYDPQLESFRVAAIVPSGNILATQTELQDGRIFVCGGIGVTGAPVASAFLFDPKTGLSEVLPDMASPRAGHASARLNDGRVLIVGGANSLDFADLPTFLAGIRNDSEIFDPRTKTFAGGPSMLEQKMFHTATTLGNGEVLVAGGLSVVPVLNVPIVSPTAQSYTPSLNVFGFPRLMASARMLHGAATLGNGRAVLAGGLTIDFTKFLQTQNIADLSLSSVDDAVTYTPGLFGGFSAARTMRNGRLLPAVAPMGADEALIAGGFELSISTAGISFQLLKETDVLKGSAMTPGPDMLQERLGAVAVPLLDGTVLVTGGTGLTSEIFQR